MRHDPPSSQPASKAFDEDAPGCHLCGLAPPDPPIRGDGHHGDRAYCCSGCLAVDEILEHMPAEQRGAARAEIARRLGLPSRQLEALGIEPEAPAPDSGPPPRTEAEVEHRVRVSGLHCPSCAWLVEHVLEEQPGVSRARVDFMTEVATVRLDLRKTSREAALRALSPLGYGAAPLGDEGAGDPERLAFRFGVAAVAAMNAMMLAWVHYAELWGARAGDWKALIGGLAGAIALPAVVYAGGPIFRRAAGLAARGRVAMETLLAVGIAASLGLSLAAFVLPGANFYWEVPTMIVASSLASRLLDRGIRRNAAARVSELLEPRAVRVRLEPGEGEAARYVDLDALEPGDRVVVPEGEEAPADLVVAETAEGAAVLVSEAVLTGEPTPVSKRPGATVLAGSRVLRGTLRAEVLRRAEESACAQVARQILEVLHGQGERTAAADRIASLFVLGILAASVVTLAVHLLLLRHGVGGLATDALLPAIAVLVVACPCAFSIAASASMAAAAMRLLADGVLLARPEALEAAARVDTVVFDKTGTMTAGDMDVRELRWLGPPAPVALAALAGLEAASRHPLAAAIRRHLSAAGVEPAEVEDVEELPRHGVRGRAGGLAVGAGAPALFDGVAPVGAAPDGAAAAGAAADGAAPAGAAGVGADGAASAFAAAAGADEDGTRVLFGPLDRPAGLLIVDDPLRPGAAKAVSGLQALGVEARLLTGDDEAVARRVAERVGIAEVEGRALPGDKAARVAALRREGRRVLYVGDGVNDAPALAAADAGLAMRHGATMALEAAGLLALRDDPSAAALVIRLGRRLGHVTRQNYAWAIGYNLVLLPVAATGLLHPAFAALAMLLSSVTVLANAARLLRTPR